MMGMDSYQFALKKGFWSQGFPFKCINQPVNWSCQKRHKMKTGGKEFQHKLMSATYVYKCLKLHSFISFRLNSLVPPWWELHSTHVHQFLILSLDIKFWLESFKKCTVGNCGLKIPWSTQQQPGMVQGFVFSLEGVIVLARQVSACDDTMFILNPFINTHISIYIM